MLHDFSWVQYLVGAGVLITLYYLAVAALFFRDDLKRVFVPHSRNSLTPPAAEEPVFNPFKSLEAFVNQIEETLAAAGQGAGKPALLDALKPVMVGYDGLQVRAYRIAIFNKTIELAKKLCGVGISVAELEALV
ncbi:hypothetical protein [Dinghuibacter silviterrae]|uniref:Uncharacterized protein n=1 Tax=Dinghuibacter silviterrae TaxID=1539049 RepID=A0A4R8DQR4_9BACT|nr:hypothetical protein [Dinghuibacter silviterrae]TDX00500.1 hypothetical protein EDB95_1525 [Dinghuibacter silviterrae]